MIFLETLLLTCKVDKFNYLGKREKRNLLITSHAVYNIDEYPNSWRVWFKGLYQWKPMIKNRIDIRDISKISVSNKS